LIKRAMAMTRTITISLFQIGTGKKVAIMDRTSATRKETVPFVSFMRFWQALFS
jgi:hypothetical protein